MNKEISETQFEEASEIFKVLANVTRLKILVGIMHDECNVSKIVEKLGLPQSTISQHLTTMRNKGIIKGRRQGAKVCYTIVDKKARILVSILQNW